MATIWQAFWLLLLPLCFRVEADDVRPPPDSRVVDASGRYYAVLRHKGGPILESEAFTVSIAKLAPGTPAVTSASVSPKLVNTHYVIKDHPDVAIRGGDIILGRCELEAAPRELLISSRGLGLIALDVQPSEPRDRNHANSAVVLITLKGKIGFRKSLSDLFGYEQGGFTRTRWNVNWYFWAWIDEEHAQLIIVSPENAAKRRFLRASACRRRNPSSHRRRYRLGYPCPSPRMITTSSTTSCESVLS